MDLSDRLIIAAMRVAIAKGHDISWKLCKEMVEAVAVQKAEAHTADFVAANRQYVGLNSGLLTMADVTSDRIGVNYSNTLGGASGRKSDTPEHELRERALTWALPMSGHEMPEDVLRRARVYLAFLKGDATGSSSSPEPSSSASASATVPSAPAPSSRAA